MGTARVLIRESYACDIRSRCLTCRAGLRGIPDQANALHRLRRAGPDLPGMAFAFPRFQGWHRGSDEVDGIRTRRRGPKPIIRGDMSRNVIRRRTGGAAVWSCVALFVLGSNYCLLAALGGASMACLSPPVALQQASAAAATAPMSPCGHPMGPRNRQGPPPQNSPCCTTALTVPVPQVVKADALYSLLPVAPPSELMAVAAPEVERRRPHANESPPLLPSEPAKPYAGRAPPLA